MAPGVKQPFASGSGASYEDVEILRRQIVTLQETVALQERHLTAHDESLASGDRMFSALSRSVDGNFRLVLHLAVFTLCVLAVAVTALVTA